jgi:hypothetical protein
LGRKGFVEHAFIQLLTEIGAPVFDDDRAAIGINGFSCVERTTLMAIMKSTKLFKLSAPAQALAVLCEDLAYRELLR